MRKSPRILFWFIILLTILAVLIDTSGLFRSGIDQFLFSKLHRDFPFHLGLDLEGGTSITLQADMRGVPASYKNNALESAKTIIEKRVNFLGVAEPVIQTASSNNEARIIVEMPGISDVDQAIRLIGTTAQLSFWENGSENQATVSAIPLGLTQILKNPQKTDLTGKDLQQTGVTFDRNAGSPQVSLTFSNEGAKKFAVITKRNVGKIVAIVLDNQIISYPRVNVPIVDGNAVITGGFTTDQAKALSIALNAGALPIPLSVIEQHTVEATLGASSLQKSLFAGIVGFILIVIFMSVLYGRLGVLASVALVLYTLFVLALFKIIPVTLTLAGIAGFILSIGMAVDANILIFERMREETRRGKAREIAIELGFLRAWSSIRDSNVSSIITSLILIYFGTSIVRGFAVTLLIGVLVSMFSAIVVTRTFLRIIYK